MVKGKDISLSKVHLLEVVG